MSMMRKGVAAWTLAAAMMLAAPGRSGAAVMQVSDDVANVLTQSLLADLLFDAMLDSYGFTPLASVEYSSVFDQSGWTMGNLDGTHPVALLTSTTTATAPGGAISFDFTGTGTLETPNPAPISGSFEYLPNGRVRISIDFDGYRIREADPNNLPTTEVMPDGKIVITGTVSQEKSTVQNRDIRIELTPDAADPNKGTILSSIRYIGKDFIVNKGTYNVNRVSPSPSLYDGAMSLSITAVPAPAPAAGLVLCGLAIMRRRAA